MKKIKVAWVEKYLLPGNDWKFRSMTFVMASCLEFGLTGCITMIVVSRTGVLEYNHTVVDWLAYICALAALFNLVAAPIYLLRVACQIHRIAKKEIKKEARDKRKQMRLQLDLLQGIPTNSK